MFVNIFRVVLKLFDVCTTFYCDFTIILLFFYIVQMQAGPVI